MTNTGRIPTLTLIVDQHNILAVPALHAIGKNYQKLKDKLVHIKDRMKYLSSDYIGSSRELVEMAESANKLLKNMDNELCTYLEEQGYLEDPELQKAQLSGGTIVVENILYDSLKAKIEDQSGNLLYLISIITG